jgi:hypothetical protein
MMRRIARALLRSRTIFGSLLTLVSVIAGFCNDAVAVALDAAAQVTMLAPVAGLCAQLGLDTRNVTFGLAVAGITLALFARLDDARTGANSK